MIIRKMSGFADKAKNVLPPSPIHLLISRNIAWLSTITTTLTTMETTVDKCLAQP
jgi:hypothetical protein